MKKKIVVVIPCYNEEKTIKKVIRDFQKELPEARILVVDNNSFDNTSARARKAGAEVITEKRQGKGFAIQRSLEEFREEIFVMVDGDDTYHAYDVHELIELVVKDKADMSVGDRMHKGNRDRGAFSISHWYGNVFLTGMLNLFFRTGLNDMQSGLRVMNKRFVNSTALLAGGFAIEPELTIQAVEKGMIIKEVPIDLDARPSGSHSKISAVRDGTIALYTLISLFRDYKPLQFFTTLAVTCFVTGGVFGWYGIDGYFETGRVDHFPSLIVSGFFIISGLVSFIAGLILSSIKRRHDELVVLLNRIK
ncbi:MAG: glycosyl transferase [Candidatus Moraniibacteriota bacterium]|nr:MAG: glycosyl transferase [Candidatus Moranbacteria bacterium]